jgi:hypothetical protein
MTTHAKAPFGVYVLANDPMYDWMVAFLESFRAHNPDLPLSILPFDNRVERLRTLAGRYRFDVFEHASLARLDALGASFAAGPAWWTPAFRRMACFWGPYQHFLCLDCDIVTLEDVRELLEAMREAGRDFCFFDQTDECVYTSPELLERMKREHHARPFNVGYWGGRRGAFTLDRVLERAGPARAVQAGFYFCADQPFANFCVHTGGIQYGGFSDLIPDLAHHHWAARRRRIRWSGGHYRVGHRASPDFGKRLVLLHWAGYQATPFMPYRRLFLEYRLQSASPAARRAYHLGSGWRYLRHHLVRDLKETAKRLLRRTAPPGHP